MLFSHRFSLSLSLILRMLEDFGRWLCGLFANFSTPQRFHDLLRPHRPPRHGHPHSSRLSRLHHEVNPYSFHPFKKSPPPDLISTHNKTSQIYKPKLFKTQPSSIARIRLGGWVAWRYLTLPHSHSDSHSDSDSCSQSGKLRRTTVYRLAGVWCFSCLTVTGWERVGEGG